MGSERALPDNMLLIHSEDWQRCLSENIRLEVALATAERDLAEARAGWVTLFEHDDENDGHRYRMQRLERGGEASPHD
jgi:hypothetical protein